MAAVAKTAALALALAVARMCAAADPAVPIPANLSTTRFEVDIHPTRLTLEALR